MKARKIGNHAEFYRHALEALRILSDPVKATLGPDGLSILIEREGIPPLSTKDGVTVADSIEVANPILNTMIHAVKEVARKTNETAGDGTTTAIVLVQAIVSEAMKFIRAGQCTPQKIANQIIAAKNEVLESIHGLRRDVTTDTEVMNVAKISCNSDMSIAEKVVEAVESAGKDGVIRIEENDGPEILITRVEGYQIGKGWNAHAEYGPKFITDRMNQTSTLENANILLYDGTLSDPNVLAEFLNAFAKVRSANPGLPSTVIIAHDYSGQVRDVLSKAASAMTPILLVNTEILGTQNSRIYLLDDLAVLTGGRVVQHGCLGDIVNKDSQEIKPGWLGKCRKVVQGRNTTTFLGGAGKPEDVVKHTDVIRAQIDGCSSGFDKNIHRARIGKLVEGIVMVQVGGMTDLEMKERKDRVEDALNATRAAVLEGILPGGGTALLQASKKLRKNQSLGGVALSKALEYPIRQIIMNTGESPDEIVAAILKKGGGWDAFNRKFVKNMFDSGIIDPYRVVRHGFENAVSIAVEIIKGGGYCVFEKTGGNKPPNPFAGMGGIPEMPGENPDDFED